MNIHWYILIASIYVFYELVFCVIKSASRLASRRIATSTNPKHLLTQNWYLESRLVKQTQPNIHIRAHDEEGGQ